MLAYNVYTEKIGAGILASALSVFVHDLAFLVFSVFIFETVDFLTGVLKSYVLAKRKKKRFAFESIKAWRTIYKLIFILVGIVMAYMLDIIISHEHNLRLANYFTAFCCGVEFWSFLENAAAISNHPLFKWLKKFMKTKVEDQIDFDNVTKDDKTRNSEA